VEEGKRLLAPFFGQVLVANVEGLKALDHAFLQEIAHHDFEIGGKNEWDGAAVKYSGTFWRCCLTSEIREGWHS
jgi:hypothetical protein